MTQTKGGSEAKAELSLVPGMAPGTLRLKPFRKGLWVPLLPHTQLGTDSWGLKGWQLCLRASGVGMQMRGAAQITGAEDRSTGREQHGAAQGQ